MAAGVKLIPLFAALSLIQTGTSRSLTLRAIDFTAFIMAGSNISGDVPSKSNTSRDEAEGLFR